MSATECSDPGCNMGGKLRRGLCAKHYTRLRRTPGFTSTARPPHKPWTVEELHARSVRIGNCMEWSGCRLSRNKARGYGRVRSGGKLVLVHRLVWELTFWTLPPWIHVLHRCDNPPCCNPDHLFIGTQRDNMRDRHRKGWFVASRKHLSASP